MSSSLTSESRKTRFTALQADNSLWRLERRLAAESQRLLQRIMEPSDSVLVGADQSGGDLWHWRPGMTRCSAWVAVIQADQRVSAAIPSSPDDSSNIIGHLHPQTCRRIADELDPMPMRHLCVVGP